MSSRSRITFSPRLVRQNGNRNLLQSSQASRASRASRGSRSPRSPRSSRSPQSEYVKIYSSKKPSKHYSRLTRVGSVRKIHSVVRSRTLITNNFKKGKSIRASRKKLDIVLEED